MQKDSQSGVSDREGHDAWLVAAQPRKGPGILAVILLVALFDFAMWFVVPDATTYRGELGAHELDVHLSPLPLLVTGLLAGGILLILSRLRE